MKLAGGAVGVVAVFAGVFLVVACRSNGDDVSSAKSAGVGPGGGKIEVGGVVLDIPAGALDRSVTIGVTSDAPAPPGFRVNGSNYRFEPSGLVFSKEVSVSFPTGGATESVFWTVDGSRDRYERLATTLGDGHATARVRHFSNGFVGTTSGVTCTTKRRDDATCEQTTTKENPVHLWLVSNPSVGSEGAMATDSPGINDLFTADQSTPVFFATDATRTVYKGGPGTAYRSGTVVSLSLDGSRIGAYPGCGTVPFIAVTRTGTTTLGI